MIVTTTPPGKYGAKHDNQWCILVASCKATRCHHRVARAISARQMPWSLPSPSCQNTNKTQLLASDYRTFLLAELNIFVIQKGPSTHVINVTSFVTMCEVQRFKRKPSATFLAIKCWQRTKIWKVIKQSWSLLKKCLIYETTAVMAAPLGIFL